jgi:hypothetical protein
MISDTRRRRQWLFIVFILLSTANAKELPWALVFDEEMARYSGDGLVPELGTRTLPDPSAPKIAVIVPDTSTTISSPTDIRLTFQPVNGAKILPETFRVKYGALGFDVTERIVSRFRPTESGLSVSSAQLPVGRHVFVMSIQDSRGLVGSKRLALTVLDSR